MSSFVFRKDFVTIRDSTDKIFAVTDKFQSVESHSNHLQGPTARKFISLLLDEVVGGTYDLRLL